MTFYFETAVLWGVFVMSPLFFISKRKELEWWSIIKQWLMEIIIYTLFTVALYNNNINTRLEKYYDAIMALSIILVIIDKIQRYIAFNTEPGSNIWMIILAIMLAIILIVLNAIISNTLSLVLYIFVAIYYVIELIFTYERYNGKTQK